MLGHPIHPALVHFPIGLLLSATLADLAWLLGLTSDVHVAAIMMAGGLCGGLLAMGAGLYDLTRLKPEVVPHASRHMAAVGLAWTGYAVTLYLRRDVFSGATTVGIATVAVSVVSAALLALGGWLGGRLVYTFRAGVADGD